MCQVFFSFWVCTCMCVHACEWRHFRFIISLWCLEDKLLSWSLPSVLTETGSLWPGSWWDYLDFASSLTVGASGLEIHIVGQALGETCDLNSGPHAFAANTYQLNYLPRQHQFFVMLLIPGETYYIGIQHLKWSTTQQKFTTSLGKKNCILFFICFNLWVITLIHSGFTHLLF